MINRLDRQVRVVPERHPAQDGVDGVQAAGDLPAVNVDLLQQDTQPLVEVGVDLFSQSLRVRGRSSVTSCLWICSRAASDSMASSISRCVRSLMLR